MIAVLPEYLHESLAGEGIVHSTYGRDAVVVPVGQGEGVAGDVGALVPVQSPVGDPVPRGVGAGEEAAPAGGTDAAGVSLGEHHSLRGQTLHVGRLIQAVVGDRLRPERHGTVFPAHVVHHEEHYVGMPLRHRRDGCGKSERYEGEPVHQRLPAVRSIMPPRSRSMASPFLPRFFSLKIHAPSRKVTITLLRRTREIMLSMAPGCLRAKK